MDTNKLSLNHTTKSNVNKDFKDWVQPFSQLPRWINWTECIFTKNNHGHNMWLQDSKLERYQSAKIIIWKVRNLNQNAFPKIINLDIPQQIALIKYLVTACFLPLKATNKIIPRNLINYILWLWWRDLRNGRWMTTWNLYRVKSSDCTLRSGEKLPASQSQDFVSCMGLNPQ